MEKKDTGIHLPKTDFPMKGNLNMREPEMLKKWEDDKVYEILLEKRAGNPPFIFHDGPPYANGNIHMGHTLNKVLKDIVVRYKSFKGYYVPYVPGWDCHGMPIEHKVMEKLGSKAASMSKVEVRKQCKEYAMRFVDLQREQFKRLGIMADWEHPYLTLDYGYEDKMVDIFWEMYRKGMIYKGLKPVYWCSKCETALAEAEVEYADHKSPTVYVRFKVKDDSKSKVKLGNDAYVVIWTTTPWTLPANVAIAVHPDFDYVLADCGGAKYVVAAKLLENFAKKTGLTVTAIEKQFKGSDLEYMTVSHPFLDRDSLLINAAYVTLDAGTGCVHIAPGHGHDDYVASRSYKLSILNPVDNKGRFTDEFAMMKGEYVFKANPKVVELLREKGALLAAEEITHSYPHCWRCKSPIIFRATNQWFIAMDRDGFREKALAEVKSVKWMNSWGEERISKMIQGRPDWCISRQRSWGVPIFVFSCTDCGTSIVNENTIAKVHEVIKKEGSDGWFSHSTKEILGDCTCPKCGSKNIDKENDIFDVWFDSGSSSFAVLENRRELSWPADFYFEGSDQYRGWFQASLLTAVGYKGRAPYKSVISSGWIVDGQGRAMHKSLGNVIDPLDLIKKSGADVLRLWAAYEDFTTDQPVSDEILSRVSDSYRRVRNTFRYMLGALDDFNREDAVPYEKMGAFDRYALHKLAELEESVEKNYENYSFYRVCRDYIQFCSTFLSSFYFDVLKDRLYTYKTDGLPRRSGQTVIYRMFLKLSKLIAPILAYTADEAWSFLPDRLKSEKHIQWTEWNDGAEKKLPAKDASEWEAITAVRDMALKKIEERRAAGEIKHPYEAAITIKYASKELDVVFNKYKSELESVFIVSHIDYKPEGLKDCPATEGVEITVRKAGGVKCGRCWRFEESTGKNADYPELCSRCIDNL
ncbi:MAG: isoleucine--tRNA ligase [Spirochaetia bacterium]|nr:isoleucine--tRNA ligase [Spirochaetia bacterium]